MIDTILPVSYNDTISFDHTGSYIGSLGNQIPLSLTPPTTNLFTGSNFSDLARAATFFNVTDYPIRTAVEFKYWYGGVLNKCGCSGIMVAPNLVLTAAHCVYYYTGHVWNGDSILIAPAFDNGVFQPSLPTGTSDKYYLFKSYYDHDIADVALIELHEPIGQQIGWIGMAFANNNTYFQNKVLHKLSYPGNWDHDSTHYYNCDTMYYNYGYIDDFTSTYLGINSPEALAIAGQSGSSFFYTDNNEYYSFGVLNWEAHYFHFRMQNRYYYQLKNIMDNYANGLENIISPINTNVSIYPNPATNNLTIETTEKSEIEISNIAGQILKTFNTTEKQTTIDVSNLPSGVYIIKAKTEKGVAVRKFVKN